MFKCEENENNYCIDTLNDGEPKTPLED